MVFHKKNIVITGASRGIGRAIALDLAQRGAHLILIARKEKPLKKLTDDICQIDSSLNPETFMADVSSWKEVQVLFSKITKSNRNLDGLINNVGLSEPGYFHEIPMNKFETGMQVNYMSAVYCCRSILPHLNKGGFIGFTSSVAGFMGVFGYSTYSGPKFALIGLAETLQQELAHQKISISVLCPPDTETPGLTRENKTRPYETKKLSKRAKLMSAEKVAKKFVKKLSRGKFLITCNFESTLFFRLHCLFPSLVRKVMILMICSFQKKKDLMNK